MIVISRREQNVKILGESRNDTFMVNIIIETNECVVCNSLFLLILIHVFMYFYIFYKTFIIYLIKSFSQVEKK